MHQIEKVWKTTLEAAIEQRPVPLRIAKGIGVTWKGERLRFLPMQIKSPDHLAVRVRARVLAVKRAPLEGVQNARGGRPRLGDLARHGVDPALDVGELLQQVLLDGINRRGLRRR